MFALRVYILCVKCESYVGFKRRFVIADVCARDQNYVVILICAYIGVIGFEPMKALNSRS